jgi:hypothetical protein
MSFIYLRCVCLTNLWINRYISQAILWHNTIITHARTQPLHPPPFEIQWCEISEPNRHVANADDLWPYTINQLLEHYWQLAERCLHLEINLNINLEARSVRLPYRTKPNQTFTREILRSEKLSSASSSSRRWQIFFFRKDEEVVER